VLDLDAHTLKPDDADFDFRASCTAARRADVVRQLIVDGRIVCAIGVLKTAGHGGRFAVPPTLSARHLRRAVGSS